MVQDTHANTRSEVDDRPPRGIAFALGGLAGSNAHGVGFLAAAQDVARNGRGCYGHDILPQLRFISCTSGMIPWVYRFLKPQPVDLKEELDREIDAIKKAADGLAPQFESLRGLVVVLFTGLPGVFRPVLATYGQDWLERWLRPWNWSSSVDAFWEQWFDAWLPARLLVPARAEEEFHHISEVFNHTDIGIAFNSFDPKEGLEYLHVNEAGLELIQQSYDANAEFEKPHEIQHYDNHYPSSPHQV